MNNIQPQPFRDLDLPQQHFVNGEHYVPPRSRNSVEAFRRRTLPTGAVLAEQQQRGLLLVSKVLELVEDPQEATFLYELLAGSGINSAAYSLQTDRTQRSRLKLPILADDYAEWRQDIEGLKDNSQHNLLGSLALAETVVTKTINRSPSVERHTRSFGHQMGKTAIEFAVLSTGTLGGGSAYDVQDWARQQGLKALDFARTAHRKIGSHPSIAQFDDRDSDVMVYTRRNAPDQVVIALEQAIEEPVAA